MFFLAFDIIGNGGDLHVHMGIEAEVPEAAIFVGEGRGDRGVVEVEHCLVGIALIMLIDGIDQGAGHIGPVALGDESDALIDGAFKLDQAVVGA